MSMRGRLCSEIADGTYVEPIDVLVPVCPCDGGVCDVRLLGVVLGVAVGLSSAGHGGAVRLGSLELGLDGVVGLDGLVGRHFDRGGVRRGGGKAKVQVEESCKWTPAGRARAKRKTHQSPATFQR